MWLPFFNIQGDTLLQQCAQVAWDTGLPIFYFVFCWLQLLVDLSPDYVRLFERRLDTEAKVI
jgi:hypothetical protein